MGTIWLVLNDLKFLLSPKAEGCKGKEVMCLIGGDNTLMYLPTSWLTVS